MQQNNTFIFPVKTWCLYYPKCIIAHNIGLDYILKSFLLHRRGHCRDDSMFSLITPAFPWLLSIAPYNCLTLWFQFPVGLKAMPYPRAHTQKHVCAHGSRYCWGSGNMEHIHQRKTLRRVTMEISVSETPSKFALRTDCVCEWVYVCETQRTRWWRPMGAEDCQASTASGKGKRR